MFIFMLNKLLRWILSLVFMLKLSKRHKDHTDYELKSAELSEKKLNQVLFRGDQVDSRTYESDNNLMIQLESTSGGFARLDKQNWMDIPDIDTDFIKFYRDKNSVIQSSRDFIFSGILMKQKKVTIKSASAIYAREELSIAKKLRYHENFL